eukprot:UN19446
MTLTLSPRPPKSNQLKRAPQVLININKIRCTVPEISWTQCRTRTQTLTKT